MTGISYGTPEGGAYGTEAGGHYGAIPRGNRVEITGPEEQSPSIRTGAILSVDLSPEHTGYSEMTIELPPLEGLTESAYLNGLIQYSKDEYDIFTASITKVNQNKNSGTVSVTGKGITGHRLDTGYREYTFNDIPTARAIEQVLADLDNDSRVYESPFNPIVSELIQQAQDTGGFNQALTAGEQFTEGAEDVNSDRFIPTDVAGIYPEDYVPSIHPTTPLDVDFDGITTTQTTEVIEAEDGETNNVTPSEDLKASGERAVILKNPGDSVKVEFKFDHQIPAGHFDVAFRARKRDLGSAYELLEIKLDGSTVTNVRIDVLLGFPDYKWIVDEVISPNAVDARSAVDSDPHTIEIIKQNGDDDIHIDAIAPRDNRFDFGTNVDEDVDNNNALTGPPLYPQAMPIVLDDPGVGAIIDIATFRVNFDVETSLGSPFIAFPGINFTALANEVHNSTYNIKKTVYDLDPSVETSRVMGGIQIARYDESNKTTTPTQGTRSQEVQEFRMYIDGSAESVISEPRTFSGTPFEILKEMHEFSGRVMTFGHNGNTKGRIESFARGDPKLQNDESKRWITTDSSQEKDRERYANVVIVTGADIEGGNNYSAIARNEDEIRRIQRISPEGDDGYRIYRTTDRSLESDSDCRSKARSLLSDLSSIKQAGDATISPEFPTVGQPYYTPFSAEEDAYSTLETASITLSPDGSSTSVAFETIGGITEVLESLDSQQNDIRDTDKDISGPGGGAVAENLGIGYLDPENPLSDAAYVTGGSAGEGTHGAFNVERPPDMPTKEEATDVVSTTQGLLDSLNAAVSGDIIYIEADIDISSFSSVQIPAGVTLVAGYCDPNIPGRGPVLYSDTFNRYHFKAGGNIDLWGISLEGPRQDYFDPREQEGTESDYYTSGIHCYGTGATDGTDAFIYGCEFRGWTVGAVELGSSNDATQAVLDRSTFINNPMETFGYGIYQYDGHADIERCYFNNNRHSIAGFGNDTESYRAVECMHGPETVSHAFDMHSPDNTSGNTAGRQVIIERCTFPFTESYIYNMGQEAFRIRGVSVDISQFDNNHCYHPTKPTPPGEGGDAYLQNVSGDSFVSFDPSGNNFGKRLEQNKGCPLNVPIEPKS